MIQAALDRYRQTLAAIEERRALGRALGRSDVDAACDEALRRLEVALSVVRPRRRAARRCIEPMDRAAAHVALEILQTRHNAELAAVAAMRDEAAAAAARNAAAIAARPSAWKNRAAMFVRGLLPPKDGSRVLTAGIRVPVIP